MEWKTFKTPPEEGQKIIYFDDEIDGKIATGYYRDGVVVDESFQQTMFGASMWRALPELPSRDSV